MKKIFVFLLMALMVNLISTATDFKTFENEKFTIGYPADWEVTYYGDDWIFFDDAYLSYEGNTYSVSFDKYREKETDNSGGMVWEWIDVNVDGDLLNYLKLYVKGQKPKMRLTGKYTHDRNLSAKEIKAMQEVLLAYDVLKNGR